MPGSEWLEKGRELKEEAREALRCWDLVARPQGDPPYFEGDSLPPFDDTATEYSDTNAWWLCELSRIVYKRDVYEMMLPGSMPSRYGWLEARGISQITSYNTAGSHFALFRFSLTRTGRPALVLCFRGTSNLLQWLLNLTALLDPWGNEAVENGPEVHQGFKYIFEKLWPAAESFLTEAEGPVYYTGHSLGGALATLAAARRRPDALYTFGSPRVGNGAFVELLNGLPFHRVVFQHDIVTQLPVPSGDPPDFVHGGILCYLGENGALLIDPPDEEVPEPVWNPEKPLASLMEAFETSGAHPPAPMLDHVPVRYAEALKERMPH